MSFPDKDQKRLIHKILRGRHFLRSVCLQCIINDSTKIFYGYSNLFKQYSQAIITLCLMMYGCMDKL